MISSAADYDFVTGITNGEVLINGEVMPWRDEKYTPDMPLTAAPKCLRGEDLCFLHEACAEVMCVVNATYPSYTISSQTLQYDKKLDQTPFQGFIDTVASDYVHNSWNASYGYIMFNGQQLSGMIDFSDNYGMQALLQANGISARTTRYGAYVYGRLLSADQIRNIYADMQDARALIGSGRFTYTRFNSAIANVVHENDSYSPQPRTNARGVNALSQRWRSDSNPSSGTIKRTAWIETAISSNASGFNLSVDISRYVDHVDAFIVLRYYKDGQDHYPPRAYEITPVLENGVYQISHDAIVSSAYEYCQHNNIQFIGQGGAWPQESTEYWPNPIQDFAIEVTMSFFVVYLNDRCDFYAHAHEE